MDDIAELTKAKEFEQLMQAIGDETDKTGLVLRSHLYAENLLERLIIAKLARGDKIIEHGNFTYHQKLTLVDSLDCLADRVVTCLRNLNKLRNQCAHELHKKITDGDVARLGSSLGKTFAAIRRETKFDEVEVLRRLISHICGYVAGVCNAAETAESKARRFSEEQPPADGR
jgi:hypothetical protein